MTKAHVICLPDASKIFEVADASRLVIGSVLGQENYLVA